MEGAIVQGRPEIDGREPGQHPFVRRFGNAFFNRRNILARHRSADDFIDELEPGTSRQRFDLQPDVGILAATARLLFVFALQLGLATQGFTIRHLWRFEQHLDIELALELFGGDLDMDLPHSRQDQFLGFLVAPHLQGGILFDQLVQSSVYFIFIVLAGRFEGKGDNRLDGLGIVITNRLGTVAQGIAGGGFLEFGHRHDIAGRSDLHRRLLLAVEHENLADALGRILIGIVEVAV